MIKRRNELEDRLRDLQGEGAKAAQLAAARREADRDVERILQQSQGETDSLDTVLSEFKALKPKKLVTEENYRSLRERFGDYFEGNMGAEAIKRLLGDLDLEAEAEFLRDQIKTAKGTRRQKAIKRLKVVNNFIGTKNSPGGMVLDAIPVIPPELRPWSSWTAGGSPPRT